MTKEDIEYTPFGEEWENAIMRFNKKRLVELLRKTCIENQQLKSLSSDSEKETEENFEILIDAWQQVPESTSADLAESLVRSISSDSEKKCIDISHQKTWLSTNRYFCHRCNDVFDRSEN